MFVSAAGHDVEAGSFKFLGENLGVFHYLVSVGFKFWLHSFVESYPNPGDTLVLGSPLESGEDSKINFLGNIISQKFFAGEDHRANRAAQRLPCGHGDNVGVGER